MSVMFSGNLYLFVFFVTLQNLTQVESVLL